MRSKTFLITVILLVLLSACTNRFGTQTSTPLPTLQAIPLLPLVSSPEILRFTMIDPNNGWAVSETAVLRTIDGGSTWYDATPSGLASVGYSAAICFLDAYTAWIVTPDSNLTRGFLHGTQNGGESWTSVEVDFPAGYLSFPDEINGWALVALGAAMSHEAVAVFQTGDGGLTWTQSFTNEPNSPGTSDSLPFVGNKTGITSLDATHAWVTGSQPSSNFIYLYMTQDGGSTWTHQEPAFPDGFLGAMATTYPPRFFNTTNGVMPTAIYADAVNIVFYTTADAGLTWSPTTPVPLNGQVSIATLADFFVWDGDQSLFASNDAGNTWSQVTPDINLEDTLAGFQFVDMNTGWALSVDSANHHALYRTDDGGTTWTTLIP
jgi:photosystem II stability/assembly factor-like uncharacterized protein